MPDINNGMNWSLSDYELALGLLLIIESKSTVGEQVDAATAFITRLREQWESPKTEA